MRKGLFVFLMSIIMPVYAGDWSMADTTRETSWQVINIVDWGQSLDISERRDEDRDKDKRYKEANPLLGETPSRGDVNRYFIASGLSHYGMSTWLSPSIRSKWQYGTIGVSAGFVLHNYSLGVRVNYLTRW